MSGIYIHIPFCKQACHYCNFHFSTTLHQKNNLIDAIIKEINLTPHFSSKTEESPIKTIYFGGGTPSILSITDIRKILEAIHQNFNIDLQAEITLEANPDDITNLSLAEWLAAGINRLSVGIQSFTDEELTWMNRSHSAKESLHCLDKIKNSGFDNFSIDLIYGSPLLEDHNWKKNVSLLLEQQVPHISCYALTVEPKTALEKMVRLQKKEKIDAEKQARQFLLLMEWMKDAGYEHYEISNFALPGKRSRHNSSYWQQKKYYGFGPAAHSFDGKKRKWNIASNTLYITSLQKNYIPFEEETLTTIQQLNEYIMTALRTIEGIDLNFIAERFGSGFLNKIKIDIEKYIENETLQLENGRLQLTKEGKLFADGIAADLFFD